MSSWLVEPDVDGVVELCAANMDTEKHNAAALVSSFFMVFRLLVFRQNLPIPTKMRAAYAGLPRISGKRLRRIELRVNHWFRGVKVLVQKLRAPLQVYA